MGVSLRVIGIKPPDEKFIQMLTVYESCKKAKIDPPSEVEKFFNYDTPDPNGVVVKQKDLGEAVTKHSGDMENGFCVDITKLPKDITVIKFINSY